MYFVSAVSETDVIFADTRETLAEAQALARVVATDQEPTYSEIGIYDEDCRNTFDYKGDDIVSM